MARFLSFWRNLLRRDRVEQDLDDEVRAAIDILTEEKVTAGMTPQEARRAAAIELGGVESVKEQVRDVRSGAFVETFLQDLRYDGATTPAPAAVHRYCGVVARHRDWRDHDNFHRRQWAAVSDAGRRCQS